MHVFLFKQRLSRCSMEGCRAGPLSALWASCCPQSFLEHAVYPPRHQLCSPKLGVAKVRKAPEGEAPELQARPGEEGQGRDGHFLGHYGKPPRYCWMEGLSLCCPSARLSESGPAAPGLWRGVTWRKRTLSLSLPLCFRCGIYQGRKNTDRARFVDCPALFICFSFCLDFHSLSLHPLTH